MGKLYDVIMENIEFDDAIQGYQVSDTIDEVVNIFLLKEIEKVMQEIARDQATAIIQDKYWEARQSGINLVEPALRKAIEKL